MTTTKKSPSLERIYPEKLNTTRENDQLILEIHLQRYQFAEKKLIGSDILDLS